MNPKNLPIFGAILAAALSPSLSEAQLPSSELHTIYPPVAAAGETVEVSLTGANLEELKGLQFSDARIKGEPVMLPASEFRKFPAQDGTKFKVTVPADIPPGIIEVRAIGYFGLSTSRAFTILSKGTKTLVDAGNSHFAKETAPALPLDTVAYGTTDADAIDYWKFTAKKDQRLLIHCLAMQIDSKADATLEVVNASGKELEHSRDVIGRDPLIDFTAPADGDYWVGVHDFLFNGGPDYVYQLTISGRPQVDAVFPPAGQPGQVIEVTLLGRNLPGGSPGEGLSIDGKPVETVSARITVPKDAPAAEFDFRRPSHASLPGFDYQFQNANAVKLGFANAPVIVEQADAALPLVTPPAEIAGRFDAEGDTDEFRFTAKKGVTYWIEAIGDRISGKIDPYLVVEKITKGAEGTETFATVKETDDDPSKGGATFDTATRDATISFAADQDGEYRVTIIDQFGGGGPDRIYRIGIREAKPDFSLTAITERRYLDANQAFPAAPLIRSDGTSALKVLIDRNDGFAGSITLKAEGLPKGVTCPPVTVSEKDTSAWLVFKGSPEAAEWAGQVKISGTAKIGEAEVTRQARSGSLVWGVANVTTEARRARLDTVIPLAVSTVEKDPAVIEVASTAPLTVEMGQKLEIPVKVLSRSGIKGNLTVSIDGLRGLTKSPTVDIAEKANDGKLTLDFKPVANTFAPEAGTFSFALKGTGTTKYRLNPQAVDRATEEQKLADELAKKYADAVPPAKAAVDSAKKALDQANQTLSSATAEAKPQAEKSAADAKTAFDAATKTLADAEAKKADADKAKTDAAARLKAANDKAKEKDVKFVVYSPVIAIEIKPAPEPAKK
ncbi:MAG: pre-peptidase C-terminal domain-containing protein [Verrucomicrobiae bacterium]|nr:pre-peptidase C-terminal domain-containing protein [Verrucomicrobiae bacterium]